MMGRILCDFDVEEDQIRWISHLWIQKSFPRPQKSFYVFTCVVTQKNVFLTYECNDNKYKESIFKGLFHSVWTRSLRKESRFSTEFWEIQLLRKKRRGYLCNLFREKFSKYLGKWEFYGKRARWNIDPSKYLRNDVVNRGKFF